MCNQNSEVFRELCEIDHDMPFVKQTPFWFSIGSSCFFMFILLDMWDQQNSNSKRKTHKTCDPSSQPSTSKMQRPSVSLCGPVKRQPTSSPDVSAQIPDRYYLLVDRSGIQTFPKIWVHPHCHNVPSLPALSSSVALDLAEENPPEATVVRSSSQTLRR